MAEKDNSDAYRDLTYIASYHTDFGVKLPRKENFDLCVRQNGENSFGRGYDGEEIPRILATQLLLQGKGRFEFDSISFILNNANENIMPKEIYEAMLQISPGMLLQRGLASVRAFGEERGLLEKIAQATFKILGATLGEEMLRKLAPRVPGEYNHNLMPMVPSQI